MPWIGALLSRLKIAKAGLLKNDPDDVGGWPELASGTPYADGDKDGIADDWESKRFGP